MDPLVSVVIPVFNGANFLGDAIESALDQDYPNVEVVVVDDGSTDEGATAKAVRQYAKWIRAYRKPNGGAGSALNFGIQHCSGQFISWLSHDDMYRSDKLSIQVQAILDATSPLRTVVYSGWHVVDAQSRWLRTQMPSDVLSPSFSRNSLWPTLVSQIHGCALLMPRTMIMEAGGFREDLPTTQDYRLWFDMFPMAQLIYVDEPLIYSREHPDQGSLKISSHTHEADLLWVDFISSVQRISSKLGMQPVLALARLWMHLRASGYLQARTLVSELLWQEVERHLSAEPRFGESHAHRSHSGCLRSRHRAFELDSVANSNYSTLDIGAFDGFDLNPSEEVLCQLGELAVHVLQCGPLAEPLQWPVVASGRTVGWMRARTEVRT